MDLNLNDIINTIKQCCKEISKTIHDSKTTSLSEQIGSNNASGDQVKHLDLLSHNILFNTLAKNKHVYGIISEEHDGIYETSNNDNDSDGSYIVAFDPLDGSSNIQFNVTIGTIFGIYKLNESKQIESGNSIVASGYCLYGFKTEFIYTNPNTKCVESLQLVNNTFELINNNIKIPTKGKYYSINHANAHKWQPAKLNDAVSHFSHSGYSLRYVGSMVADAHRVLLNGGLFMYPADTKNKNGKIRLLYEAYPFAYLINVAGGKSSNFEKSILDIKMPTNIHQETPIILGTIDEVSQILSMV